MRRLIVNADDFALTTGVNRAIVEAHNAGIVTSASMMANGVALESAVQLGRANPRLGVGCHVVLVDGNPVLPAEDVASLVADHPAGSAFVNTLSTFAGRSLLGRLDPAQIEAEAIAQFRKLQSSGLRLTHFDTHKHTHIVPSVTQALLLAAGKCGIRAVRNPFVPSWPWLLTSFLGRPRLWRRYLEVRALRSFASAFRRKVKRAGLATTDGILGVVVTGVLDERWFETIIAAMPEGTWEFVCHPGYNDDDLGRAQTRLRASREDELHLLTSQFARDVLARHGVELICFQDLAA